MRSKFWTWVVLAVAVCGCEQAPPVGSFSVNWLLGLETASSQKCSSVGIKDVHVVMRSSGKTYERQVTCSGSVAYFDNIPQTGYKLMVSGLNADGCPIYYGQKSVSAGELDQGETTLRLESVPASGTVKIAWWFYDARLCVHHGVDKVSVTVFRNDVEILSEEVDCDMGGLGLEAVESGSYSILVEAESNEGRLCNEYHNLTLDPCGTITAESALDTCP